MVLKNLAGLPKKKIEEKITNRILINIGYTIIGYILLYIFYQYGIGRIGDILTYKYVMCGIFCLLAVLAAALYVLSFSKQPHLEKHSSSLRNYGHMATGIAIVAFYLNLPFYTQWAPIEASSGFVRLMLIFLKNTRYSFYVVGFAMLVYLLGCIVYNTVMMKKLTNQVAGKKSK